MIEATSNLPPFPSYVLITLAQREARLAVKEQLRARGLKPQYMRVSEINRAADIYLKANARELLEEAWRKCQGSADLMRFYEKEQRERKRALERNFRTFVQFTKPRQSRTSAERNSCTQWGAAMTVKGYARVSTDGQTLDAQHAALKEAGATQVFSEKQSGIKTDRAALARCLASLDAGDTVLVTKLDRLARSTRDLLNTLDAIAEAGASFKSLGDPWADTTTPHGRLMLTVLGGLAEFERHLILSRTDEGRQRAKARGIKFGRRPKLTRHQREEALQRRRNGETLVDIAKSYNVSHMTISRL
jgi:DNA invertase Pin-like site-specific DNA recombinase